MRCPICGKPVTLETPEMPFCSERCRLLDLGNWASEKYVIPGGAVNQEEDDNATPPEAEDE
jgi:endogenous inhibitor of DNA gyrase (YacG/DUF329 family)